MEVLEGKKDHIDDISEQAVLLKVGTHFDIFRGCYYYYFILFFIFCTLGMHY